MEKNLKQSDSKLFYLLLALAMVGWGASWVNAKILSRYIDEYEMVFMRFGLTILTMIPVIIYLKKSFKIDKKSLLLSLITSIAFIGYMKYFYLGTKYGTASLGGALVTSLVPIITFVMLSALGIKKTTKSNIYALMLGAIGVLTMLGVWSMNPDQIFVIQNLYFMLAAMMWPIVTILSSKSTKISPIVFSLYLYVFTVILVSLFLVDFDHLEGALRSADVRFWLNMTSMVLLASTFANTVYFVGVEKLGAGEVSSFIFLVPSAAIALSVIFLNEQISIWIIVGLLFSLTAIRMLNRA